MIFNLVLSLQELEHCGPRVFESISNVNLSFRTLSKIFIRLWERYIVLFVKTWVPGWQPKICVPLHPTGNSNDSTARTI
jgi:hypothetical protein